MLHAPMHSPLHTPLYVEAARPIEDMTFAELDALRERLRLPQALVCQRSDINPTTYVRWRRWARGEAAGSQPGRRSMAALREVLKSEAARLAAAGETAGSDRAA